MIGVWCSMFNEFMMRVGKELKKSFDNEWFD